MPELSQAANRTHKALMAMLLMDNAVADAQRASLAPSHAACAVVARQISRCWRRQRVDAAPSPRQASWGGCSCLGSNGPPAACGTHRHA